MAYKEERARGASFVWVSSCPTELQMLCSAQAGQAPQGAGRVQSSKPGPSPRDVYPRRGRLLADDDANCGKRVKEGVRSGQTW
jgi:hypothetical protein